MCLIVVQAHLSLREQELLLGRVQAAAESPGMLSCPARMQGRELMRFPLWAAKPHFLPAHGPHQAGGDTRAAWGDVGHARVTLSSQPCASSCQQSTATAESPPWVSPERLHTKAPCWPLGGPSTAGILEENRKICPVHFP